MFPMLALLTDEKPLVYNRLSEDEYTGFLMNLRKICSLDLSELVIDMTPGELALVYHAAIHRKQTNGQNMTVAEAAEVLRVSVPAISRTLKNLERKGYVSRVTDESDRRSVRISITDTGNDVLIKNLRRSTQVMDDILARFTDEELHSMIALHSKFVKAVSDTISEIN